MARMLRFILVSVSIFVPAAAPAFGQAASRSPHIGYVYPAGGKQGERVRVLVDGQSLRNTTGVHV